MSSQPPSCYQKCNEMYTSIQPERIFCKKGCDGQEKIQNCKNQTCNTLCLKGQSGDHKLFTFLYRAPKNPGPCLSSCIYGCNHKDLE